MGDSNVNSLMADRPVTPPLLSTARDAARIEWIYLHAGFILIGVTMTMMGPVLPYFTHRWSLNESQAALFLSSLYLANFVGTLATSTLLPRYGFSRVISLGYLLFVVGVALVGTGTWYFSLGFVFIYGLGYGLANPAVNLRATVLPSKNVAAAVSLLNFTWGIGAVAAPFIVAFFLGHLSFRFLTTLLSLGFLALSLVHFTYKAEASSPVARPKRTFAVWRARLQGTPWVALVQLFFFYVGIEISVGGLVALDEKKMVGMTSAGLAAAPAFFYGFLLLGRFLVPWELRVVSQRALSVGCLALAAVGIAIVALAQTPVVLYVGALLAGFGCAPQYPIYVTWLAARYKDDSTWLGALFFGIAGLGGSAMPGLVGLIGTHTHSLRYGFILPLACAVWMIPFALRACPGRSAPSGEAAA
jgi:MFS transporter, FHS family, glucose/mannose:H+ symporter